ncbi:MAG: DNA repair and recombination protein RadA [Nanoarchaeota archaeon]|nr:DNA repair and recombination protein RadA [Nanoarchaeota archaeon]
MSSLDVDEQDSSDLRSTSSHKGKASAKAENAKAEDGKKGEKSPEPILDEVSEKIENKPLDKSSNAAKDTNDANTTKNTNTTKNANTTKNTKDISIMDLPGVGAATAEKLINGGFDNLMRIAVSSPGELVNVAGVTEMIARKIIKASRDGLNMGFESGVELLRKRKEVVKISTGSKAFDALIGGGIETGAITECYGAYGSGKTSLAHQLVINAQLPVGQGGAGGGVVWIDTEGTIRPEYIKQLAEARNLDPMKILENFRGVRSFNSDHQMLLVEKVEELIKQGFPLKLIIVDSLMSHYRSEFVGRGTLADRQQRLNKHMHALLKLATNYSLAVYVTNQVMARPDTFFGDPTEAIGGHIVAHTSTVRVYLRRGKKGTRVAKLVDAPALPDGEVVFQITDEGIKDV